MLYPSVSLTQPYFALTHNGKIRLINHCLPQYTVIYEVSKLYLFGKKQNSNKKVFKWKKEYFVHFIFVHFKI